MVVIIALAYMFTGGNFDANSLSQNILVNVLSSVIFVVLTPLFATFSVILFNNLKETKQSQPSDQIQNI
jgi:hypothetical protein